MSETFDSHSLQDATLVEAFRRVHFLDHVFPVFDPEAPSRTQSFELSVVASGLEQAEISACRQEGLLRSIDDYNDYLEGGVKSLSFDDSFMSHLAERIHQACLMAAPNN